VTQSSQRLLFHPKWSQRRCCPNRLALRRSRQRKRARHKHTDPKQILL